MIFFFWSFLCILYNHHQNWSVNPIIQNLRIWYKSSNGSVQISHKGIFSWQPQQCPLTQPENIFYKLGKSQKFQRGHTNILRYITWRSNGLMIVPAATKVSALEEQESLCLRKTLAWLILIWCNFHLILTVAFECPSSSHLRILMKKIKYSIPRS